MDETNENRDGGQGGSSSDNAGMNDARAAMMKEIDTLKQQVASLTSKLSDGAVQAKETASDWYDSAAGQARNVSEVAKAFPVAVSSVSLLGLILGVLLGFAIAHSSQPSRPWYDRSWR